MLRRELCSVLWTKSSVGSLVKCSEPHVREWSQNGPCLGDPEVSRGIVKNTVNSVTLHIVSELILHIAPGAAEIMSRNL